MSLLSAIEWWVKGIGAAAAIVFLIAALSGIWRGLRRPPGRATGQARRVLRLPFYVLVGVAYFGLCFLLWRPFPLTLSSSIRIVALALGTLLYFPGLALWLWGWRTLGEMFNVSSGFGVQFAKRVDQRLIRHGPFAVVRHPMYLGLLIAAFGGIMVYQTWTTVFVALNFLGLVVRARREEQTLAAEFGEQWEAYCRSVPAWIPRFRRGQKGETL